MKKKVLKKLIRLYEAGMPQKAIAAKLHTSTVIVGDAIRKLVADGVIISRGHNSYTKAEDAMIVAGYNAGLARQEILASLKRTLPESAGRTIKGLETRVKTLARNGKIIRNRAKVKKVLEADRIDAEAAAIAERTRRYEPLRAGATDDHEEAMRRAYRKLGLKDPTYNPRGLRITA